MILNPFCFEKSGGIYGAVNVLDQKIFEHELEVLP